MYSLKDASSVAAKWWKEQLASNSMTKYTRVISEDHPMAILSYLMQDSCSQKQLDSFYRNLKRRIDKELETKSEITLSCHSYPCELLEGVGNFSDILGISFPTFVEMVVSKNLVKVRFLDTKKFEVLFENKKKEECS